MYVGVGGNHSLLISRALLATLEGDTYSKDVGYHSVSHDKKPVTKEKKTYNTTKRTILVDRSVDDQMSGSDTEESEGEEEEQIYRHRPKNNKRPAGDCLVGQPSPMVTGRAEKFLDRRGLNCKSSSKESKFATDSDLYERKKRIN